MKQYLELCQNILDNGEWKEPARENMPRTLSLFGTRMEFDLRKGFPLLTTKKMHLKGIVTELLWFIKGDTNIKYLVDNGCNIWNLDSYKYYLKFTNTIEEPDYDYLVDDPNLNKCRVFTITEFIDNIKSNRLGSNLNYKLGDLGKVYGHQWRDQNGVDQLKTIIDRLLTNPMGRYAILDAWNPSDFDQMALPPCHLLYQFNCVELTQEEKVNWVIRNTRVEMENLYIYEETLKDTTPKYHLDLQLYQRSVDSGLGAPYNVASSALLLSLFAQLLGMTPRKLIWVGGDTHIYENHIEQIEIQLEREPMELCKLNILKDIKTFEDLINLQPSDITIQNYKSHPRIDMELKTGL